MIYMFLSNNPSSGDINSSNLSCFFYSCNGGFVGAAWDYWKDEGLVTGGQYNSHQVGSLLLQSLLPV